MSMCFCRIILPALVIVFAWWDVSWGSIALTVIGAILIIMALTGNKCCCAMKAKAKEEPAA